MIKKTLLFITIIYGAISLKASEFAVLTPDETSVGTLQEKKQIKGLLLPFSNLAVKAVNPAKVLHYLVFLPQRIVDYSIWYFLDRKKISPEQQESLSYNEYFEKTGAGKVRKIMQPTASIGTACAAWYFFYRPALHHAVLNKEERHSLSTKYKKHIGDQLKEQIRLLEEQLSQAQEKLKIAENALEPQIALLQQQQTKIGTLRNNINEMEKKKNNLNITAATLSALYPSLFGKHSSLMREIFKLGEEKKEWEKKYEAHTQEVGKLSDKVHELAEENSALLQEISPFVDSLIEEQNNNKLTANQLIESDEQKKKIKELATGIRNVINRLQQKFKLSLFMEKND